MKLFIVRFTLEMPIVADNEDEAEDIACDHIMDAIGDDQLEFDHTTEITDKAQIPKNMLTAVPWGDLPEGEPERDCAQLVDHLAKELT